MSAAEAFEDKFEDKKEWKAVKAVLKQYRENELYLKDREQAVVTEDYQLVAAFDDLPSSPLVSEFEWRASEARRYNQIVMECINRLSKAERQIILLSYAAHDPLPTWEVANQLHVGRTLYFTSKAKALAKMYVLLGVHGLIKPE